MLVSRMQGGRYTPVDEIRIIKRFFLRRNAERFKSSMEQNSLVRSSQLLVNKWGIGSWFEILEARKVRVYVQSTSGL